MVERRYVSIKGKATTMPTGKERRRVYGDEDENRRGNQDLCI